MIVSEAFSGTLFSGGYEGNVILLHEWKCGGEAAWNGEIDEDLTCGTPLGHSHPFNSNR